MQEWPGFLELFAVLRKESDGLVAAHKPGLGLEDGPAPAVTFDSVEPWRAVQQLDAEFRSGKRTAEHARLAARGLTLLLLQLTDGMGVGDALAAQALAAVAVAESLAGHELPAERALLAMELGYSTDAERAASALPDSDPIAAYARGDLSVLEQAARKGDSAAIIMYGNALESRGLFDRLRKLLAQLEEKDRRGLRIRALVSHTERSPAYAAALVAHSVLALQRSLGAETDDYPTGLLPPLSLLKLALSSQGLLAGQMALLEKLETQQLGPFLPSPVLASFLRANLLSGMDDMGGYFIQTLGSVEAAKQFKQVIGDGAETYSHQFHRYYRNLIAAEERRLPAQELAADIRDLDAFGPQSLEETYRALRESAAYDPVWPQAIKEVTKRCDTRIACRSMLQFAASRDLLDLDMDERLTASILADAAALHPALSLLASYRKRDLAAVRKQLGDPNLGALRKLHVLGDLVDKLEADELDKLYAEAIASDPASFAVVEDYAEYLVQKSRHADARKQIERWLKHNEGERRFEVLVARTALARVLHLEGNLHAAWGEVEPLLPSMYGGALMRAALIRLDQGESHDAEAIARRRLERYQDANSVGLLARVLWRQGKHEEAADALAQATRPLTMGDFYASIAENFAFAMAQRPVDDARMAMVALAKKRFHPQWLGYLPGRLSARKEYERAIAARSGIQAPGLATLFFQCESYRDLVFSKDERQATAWLAKAVPPRLQMPLSQFCYEVGRPEVSWTVTPKPEVGQRHADYTWLLRAAAYLRDGSRRADWKQELDGYYANPVKSFYDTLGRYLLGQGSVDDVWTQVNAPDRIAEAAYFLGLRARQEGDYARAVNFWRVILENHATQEGESRWAYQQLYSWSAEGLTLEELARRRL